MYIFFRNCKTTEINKWRAEGYESCHQNWIIFAEKRYQVKLKYHLDINRVETVVIQENKIKAEPYTFWKIPKIMDMCEIKPFHVVGSQYKGDYMLHNCKKKDGIYPGTFGSKKIMCFTITHWYYIVDTRSEERRVHDVVQGTS